MLHTDVAGDVSRSTEGLAKMTVIVEVLEEFGLTVWEKKTDNILTRVVEKQAKNVKRPSSPASAVSRSSRTAAV